MVGFFLFAHPNTLVEEPALHGVARQSERRSEVLPRSLVPPAAKFHFAKRRVIEGICGEPLDVRNRPDLFEAPR